MANALDGPVVQVHVGHLERRRARHAVYIANYCESMVLSGDQHLPGTSISDRVIAPTVTVGQLGRGAPECEAYELMSQADPEGREPRAGQLADRLQGVTHRGRVSRA